MARNTFFALEDDAVANDGELVPEAQAEVEAGAAEADTRAREVEDLADATEEAVDDLGTLTDIQEVAQDSVDSGEGLDEPTARVIETAVENIRNRLNLPVRKSLVPALESFGSRNSRVAATNVVIEGIGDWLRKIWEGIKSIARRLLDKIKLFFAGIVKSNESLEKLLESLRERARNISADAEFNEKKLKNASLAETFSIAKKANKETANKLIAKGTILLTASEKITKNIELSSSKLTTMVGAENAKEDLLGLIEDIKGKLGTALNEIGLFTEETEVDKVERKPGDKAKWYGPFTGSKVLVYEEETIDAGTPNEEKRITISFERKGKIADDEIEALDRSGILSIIDAADKLLDKKKDFDKKQKNAEKVLENSEKLADSVLKAAVKTAEDANLGEQGRTLKALARQVSAFNATSMALSTGSSTIVYQTIKGAADYASASIANFKHKK